MIRYAPWHPKFGTLAKTADSLHTPAAQTTGTLLLRAILRMQVIIPGADGMFGVLPGHVPTISELKPGVVEVTTAPGEVEKYFISSGFAFAHADSTLDVCGIEIVKMEHLDASLVASGKSEAEAALGKATDEVEKAKAQIAVEVYTAMTEALNAK